MKKDDKHLKVDYTGTCLWFRDDLGYGFLECEQFKKENGDTRGVFVHYSRIMTDESFKTLAKGQVVQFQVAVTVKGLMAINVRELKVPHLIATVVNNTLVQ